MTPGTYIRKRREADGQTLESVAMMLASNVGFSLLPPEATENGRGRAEWLRQVEADEVPMNGTISRGLRPIFPFDELVLGQLAGLHAGGTGEAPQLCRHCACSLHDPCTVEGLNGPEHCYWVAEDLCSSCPVDEPGEEALPANDEGDTAPEPGHTQDVAA